MSSNRHSISDNLLPHSSRRSIRVNNEGQRFSQSFSMGVKSNDGKRHSRSYSPGELSQKLVNMSNHLSNNPSATNSMHTFHPSNSSNKFYDSLFFRNVTRQERSSSLKTTVYSLPDKIPLYLPSGGSMGLSPTNHRGSSRDLLSLNMRGKNMNTAAWNASQIQLYHSLSMYDRSLLCGGRNGFTIVKPSKKPEGFSVEEMKRVWVAKGANTKMIRCVRWNDNGVVGCGENGVWRMRIPNIDETLREEVISLESNPYLYERRNDRSSDNLLWYTPKEIKDRRDKIRMYTHVDVSSDHFLAIEGPCIHVWDWENTSDTKFSVNGSSSDIVTAKWNPHYSQTGGMSIAIATNISIKVLDVRVADDPPVSVTWRRNRAHEECIRDIAWSPFVPHWLATSSNFGDIHIWDLRYSRDPVVSLHGHDNVVRTVAWSKNHCEMLASGGADQQVRMWSLKREPFYELESIKSNFVSPIVGIEAESGKKGMFALSALGSLTCIDITPAFLRPLVTSRYPEKAELEHHIENMIYNRNFKTAFNEISTYALELKNNGEVEKALALLDLCIVRDKNHKIKHKDPEVRFRKELEEYSYFLPPNLNSKDYEDAWRLELNKKEKSEKIINLVINCQLLLYIKHGHVSRLMQLMQHIFTLLRDDINCIEIGTLKEISEAFLKYNYSEGIDFITELITIFHTCGFLYNLEPIVSMVIGEQVYETTQNPSLSEESFQIYSSLLKDSHYILIQLDFHKKITSALWESPDSAQTIINVVDDSSINGESTHLRLLSTSLLRLYLESLLTKRFVGHFFIVSSELLQKYQGFDFEFVIQDLMKDVGLPLFDSIVKNELVTYDMRDDPTKYVKKLRNIAIIILSITVHSPTIPNYLQSKLRSTLMALREELDAVHDSVKSDRNRLSLLRTLQEYYNNIVDTVGKNRPKTATLLRKMDKRHPDIEPSAKPLRDLAESILLIIQERAKAR